PDLGAVDRAEGVQVLDLVVAGAGGVDLAVAEAGGAAVAGAGRRLRELNGPALLARLEVHRDNPAAGGERVPTGDHEEVALGDALLGDDGGAAAAPEQIGGDRAELGRAAVAGG